MSASPLKIAYLTSGAGGMFCGSCLNDNALARALIELGEDVQLVPLYTPIRTDGKNVSLDQVFFGGINVYLQQRIPLFRYLPRWLDRWIDQPWLIRWATSFGIKTTAKDLGALAVSMLRGSLGFQRKEVLRLVDWLGGTLQPDLVVFSNMLTAGCVPELKKRVPVKVLVTLQGDDIFLQDLPQPFQKQAFQEIERLATSIDGFLTHSQFYADKMSGYLKIPREKFQVIPLGIDPAEVAAVTTTPANMADASVRKDPAIPTIGYLARLAPEKGLHLLAEAFILLRQQPGMEHAQLKIAGWLGPQHRAYAEGIFQRLRQAGLGEVFAYMGEVDRQGKANFLRSIDLLSVPTTYEEPKGLFVLEALAAGVPVVVPQHGSFPETLADVGGGLLHRPNDPADLAEKLRQLLLDQPLRQQLALSGQASVLSRRSNRAAALAAREVYGKFGPSGK